METTRLHPHPPNAITKLIWWGVNLTLPSTNPFIINKFSFGSYALVYCQNVLVLSMFEAETSAVNLVKPGESRLEARIVVRRHLVRLQHNSH